MNLKDIKVGTEVAVLDSPTRRSVMTDVPRQASVVEIVTTTKARRSGYGYGPSKLVNVKRVKIKMLDAKQRDSRFGRDWDKVAAADEGEEIVVDTRQVIGTWEALGGEARAKALYRQKSAALREDLETRLDALVGQFKDSRAYVRIQGSWREEEPHPSATIDGAGLIHIIELAEKGAKT